MRTVGAVIGTVKTFFLLEDRDKRRADLYIDTVYINKKILI